MLKQLVIKLKIKQKKAQNNFVKNIICIFAVLTQPSLFEKVFYFKKNEFKSRKNNRLRQPFYKSIN